MAQIVTATVNDKSGNTYQSYYINVAKPIGLMRFNAPKTYRSKESYQAKEDAIQLKELEALSVDITAANYGLGTIPVLAYAQIREQQKTLLGIFDGAIVDDI